MRKVYHKRNQVSFIVVFGSVPDNQWLTNPTNGEKMPIKKLCVLCVLQILQNRQSLKISVSRWPQKNVTTTKTKTTITMTQYQNVNKSSKLYLPVPDDRFAPGYNVGEQLDALWTDIKALTTHTITHDRSILSYIDPQFHRQSVSVLRMRLGLKDWSQVK